MLSTYQISKSLSTLLCKLWGITYVYQTAHVVEGVFPKDAWPELLFHDRFEVAHTIHDPINRHDDTNIRVFAQYPYEEDHRKAPDFDKDTDYWLYITSNDIVYEIPKAGRWHPNRIVSTLTFLSISWCTIQFIHLNFNSSILFIQRRHVSLFLCKQSRIKVLKLLSMY